MHILIFLERKKDKLKKVSLQILSLSTKIHKSSSKVSAIVFGQHSDEIVNQVSDFSVNDLIFIPQVDLEKHPSLPSAILKKVIEKFNHDTIIIPNTSYGKSIAPRLSVMIDASIVSGIVELVDISTDNFIVKKTVYSGKAFANVRMDGAKKILLINSNTQEIKKQESKNKDLEVHKFEEIDLEDCPYKVLSTEKQENKVLLPEADLVVSGGRGLKGPENWWIIENLAKELGAATACSRPVSDSGWRPHHEHVGQTGLTVSPSLYFAIGISGAIQHLAGVNSSKVIVVINKDPEAPFFKNANYGIIGDAFEVVPKIIEAVKSFKAS